LNPAPLILQQFALSLAVPGAVEAEAGVVLQARGGLPMKIANRF